MKPKTFMALLAASVLLSGELAPTLEKRRDFDGRLALNADFPHTHVEFPAERALNVASPFSISGAQLVECSFDLRLQENESQCYRFRFLRYDPSFRNGGQESLSVKGDTAIFDFMVNKLGMSADAALALIREVQLNPGRYISRMHIMVPEHYLAPFTQLSQPSSGLS